MARRHTRTALRAMAERLAARQPHWRLEWLEGCGHTAPLTQADCVNDRLATFLQQRSPVAAAA